MTHRGPDSAGYECVFNDLIGLGHRRLSILDLSASGHQPMRLLESRYTIVYNGEVFNFIELRTELEKKGYKFHTDTDTEVIVYAYHCWGVDCFNRFNGMWAMAIWDNQEQTLLLSRDRFGIKPCYIARTTDFLAFASETAAFNSLDGFTRASDEALLMLNINEPYALEGANLTPFKGITSLPAGHWMRISPAGETTTQCWFNPLDHMATLKGSQQEHTEHFKALFSDAVGLRLRADVPIATALSGGLDSSSVFAMILHLSAEGKNLLRRSSDFQRAFIASFPGTEQDELSYALEVLKAGNAEGKVIEMDFDNLPAKTESLTKSFDCIMANPPVAINSVYEGMAAEGFRISMDGHGVDEMMFGYRDMVSSLLEWQKWHGDKPSIQNTVGVLSGLYAPELRESLEARISSEMDWVWIKRNSTLHKVKRILRKPAETSLNVKANAFLHAQETKPWPFTGQPGYPWVKMPDQLAYFEFFKTTLPTLLRNYDKASMLNSVEIRMPFMDWRLVMFVFSLPMHEKMGEGYTKLILRNAMKGILPESVRTRTWKVGFNSPVQDWFNGPLSAWLMDTLSSQRFKERAWFDGKAVLEFAKKEQANGWSRRSAEQVWKLVNAHLIDN